MELTGITIFSGIIFGLVGMHFIRRGKREAHFWDVAIGILMMALPYFIDNPYLLWGGFAGLFFAAQFLV